MSDHEKVGQQLPQLYMMPTARAVFAHGKNSLDLETLSSLCYPLFAPVGLGHPARDS